MIATMETEISLLKGREVD
jgi:hypothetical protein